MGEKHADLQPAMARPQSPHRRQQGGGLSRRQTLSTAHVAATGFREDWAVVEGGQLHAFRRICSYGERVRIATLGWAKAHSLRAVPTRLRPLVGALRFAHPPIASPLRRASDHQIAARTYAATVRQT